jgi:hypothetical protein
MENTKHHNRIEQTLKSLDTIQRAEANPFLLTRVLEKMKSNTIDRVKPVWVWRMTASFILIIAINITVGLYISGNSQPTNASTESGYFSNHLYNY